MNRLRKLLPILIGLLCCTTANAHDFYSDGIYYNITSSTDLTVAVTAKELYLDYLFPCSYSGEVVIPEVVTYNNNTYRVTAIDEDAFYNSDITSVVIPNSVTRIKEHAFYGCSSLTSIIIPNSVTEIEEYAFYGCSSLTSIIIPNSVTEIEEYAFWGCNRLASIIIPNSVVKIGEDAFAGTAWYENQPDGVVYAGNVLYKYKGEMPEGTSIEIRKGTTCIVGSAFYECKNLISITIPESVTSIESMAFSNCTNLASITIPGSVTEIGKFAFSSTAWLENQSDDIVYAGNVLYEYNIVYKDVTSFEIKKGTTGIAGGAFCFSRYLHSITIPEGVISIGEGAFEFCTSLNSINIPESVTSIGEYAFKDCSNLFSIVIPKNVTSIGDNAFYGSSLSAIQVDKDNKVYDSRNDCNAIIETGTNTLIVGGSQTVIPNTVETIGNNAFNGKAQGSIAIPSSVTSIEGEAFYGCNQLYSVIIPKSVMSIGYYAFSDCSNLGSITILNDDVIIDMSAFDDTEWLSNQPDGVIYIGNTLYRYKGTMPENTSITVREGTRNIAPEAFVECSNLISITIPEGVTNIGGEAFSDCSNLTSIVLPQSLTSIGYYAFYGCSSLSSINIPKGITHISEGTFNKCTSLTSIVIPENVISIGDYDDAVFYGCTNLTTITLPKNLKYIASEVFSWCPRIQDVYCYAVDVPRTESDAFEDSYPEYATLHVPASAIESYRNTAPWSSFGKIVPLEEGSNIITQSASPVFIQCCEGVITLTDLAEDTEVTVYDTAGRKLGSAIATNRTATINTNLTMGSAAIVKFAGRSVKVIMK